MSRLWRQWQEDEERGRRGGVKSQAQLILEALQRGERLTKMDMLNRFDCMNGGGRIFDLKQKGWPVKKDMITLPSGKTVAEYWLQKLELF